VLPESAFKVVREQISGLAVGNLKSPEYRAGRAVTKALVPMNDSDFRETTPKTVGAITLDDVKRYHERTMRPDLTTIVVIGDVTPAEAKSVIDKWFGGSSDSPWWSRSDSLRHSAECKGRAPCKRRD
jgi:zinc protease